MLGDHPLHWSLKIMRRRFQSLNLHRRFPLVVFQIAVCDREPVVFFFVPTDSLLIQHAFESSSHGRFSSLPVNRLNLAQKHSLGLPPLDSASHLAQWMFSLLLHKTKENWFNKLARTKKIQEPRSEILFIYSAAPSTAKFCQDYSEREDRSYYRNILKSNCFLDLLSGKTTVTHRSQKLLKVPNIANSTPIKTCVSSNKKNERWCGKQKW